jgi:hypothetical protein
MRNRKKEKKSLKKMRKEVKRRTHVEGEKEKREAKK